MMELPVWGMVASKMATTLQRIRPTHPQGVILVHHADQDHLIVWLYDTDSSGPEEPLQCELGLLRGRLKQAGVEELGFGLSQDGRVWTVVARADLRPFQTTAGKSFFRELLAEDLGEAMRQVWVATHLLAGSSREEVLASK